MLTWFWWWWWYVTNTSEWLTLGGQWQIINFETSTEGIDNLALVIDQLLTSYDIKLTLQWIPGHCNLQGNDRADKLAKEGARKEQPDNPCSFKTLRRITKGKSREEWLRRWRDGDTGRVMYREMQEPNPNDDINSLSRKHQSAIFQLRTTHSKLNYNLNRFDPCYTPLCRNCIHPYETTDHVLFECPGLRAERERLLPPSPKYCKPINFRVHLISRFSRILKNLQN